MGPLMQEARTRYVLPDGHGYRTKIHIDDDGWQGSSQRREPNYANSYYGTRIVDCGDTHRHPRDLHVKL